MVDRPIRGLLVRLQFCGALMLRHVRSSSLLLLVVSLLMSASAQADVGSASTSGADTTAAVPDAAHKEHPEGGVPISFQADLALWSLIVFGIFLFVLGKFAWGPMIAGLDKREAGIRQAITDAEENRRKSQAMLAEYDQRLKAAEQTVQAMIAEARRDAERTGQDIIASAQKEVQLIRDRAKDDIQQATDTALAEVFATVNAQVIRATEHVLGRSLNDADQDRYVEEALAGVGR